MSFKKGTKAAKKRKEIAEAIMRENPGISMRKKFKFATTTVKKMRKKR
jgi:hypothetical protein